MLKWLWRRYLADRIALSVKARMSPETDRYIQALEARMAVFESAFGVDLSEVRDLGRLRDIDKPWKKNLHIPPLDIHPKVAGPFMAYSTCSTADFLNPGFELLSDKLGLKMEYHRKFWEWVFILHHALRTGAVAPGRRALGFAVGSEPLPSAFVAAGADVTATDAPDEIGVGQGWKLTGEHAAKAIDLHVPQIIDRERFLQHLQFKPCDMNAIPADLKGYDFCWSSCSFEHLGSIQKGLDFVLESVEKTLRVGGVACHTTEFNLSSDTDTVEEGATVLYRKSDITKFVDMLERRGHSVEPFRIAPDSHVLDFFADTPPYHAPPHLRLRLMGYVSTSLGLVITRGR